MMDDLSQSLLEDVLSPNGETEGKNGEKATYNAAELGCRRFFLFFFFFFFDFLENVFDGMKNDYEYPVPGKFVHNGIPNPFFIGRK